MVAHSNGCRIECDIESAKVDITVSDTGPASHLELAMPKMVYRDRRGEEWDSAMAWDSPTSQESDVLSIDTGANRRRSFR